MRTFRYTKAMVRGFTLIELSIVLIIIGLLVGGVLAGRDLIRQAQLSSISREYQAYKTAVNTFQLKYDAIPGDMDNATSYFSGTANGDGDNTLSSADERVDFWQQLSLSGLIDGNYTGVLGTGADTYNPENMPASGVSSGFYSAFHSGATARYNTAGSVLGNMWYLGARRPTDGWPIDGLLSAQEASVLDTKMDDGAADTGKVWVLKGNDGTTPWISGCVANNWSDTSAGAYDFSTDDPTCALALRW